MMKQAADIEGEKVAYTEPAINPERLKITLDGLNAFGRDPLTGGFNRIGYSAADMAARGWFEARLRQEGLAVTRDGVANIFGRYGPTDGPSILVGSHIDTVPQGGAFDGALGVAIGLECICAIKDAGLSLKTAVEVVGFAEEEGRFGGMLGSQALTGQVSPEWLATATDSDGISLKQAMADHGLDSAAAMTSARSPESVRAFIELHIEQGPVLENWKCAIGVAEAISGVSHLSVTLDGKANHSGTTPMEMRADAFAGLAEFANQIPAIIASLGTDQSRVTIGKVELEPNFPHTIPGRVTFSLITRDTDEAVQRRLLETAQSRIAQVARRHRLTPTFEEKSWLPPVKLDAKLANRFAAKAEALGLSHVRMPSGAGHDAQTMQSLCPSALVFVPSRGGISHAPDEFTEWDQVVTGAQLLVATLVDLAVE